MTLLQAQAGHGSDRGRPFSYLSPAAHALLRIDPKGCRWPLGEPAAADFAFCAKPRVLGSCYCAAHRVLSRSAS